MPPVEASRGPHRDQDDRRSASFAARLPPSRNAGAAARRMVRTRLGRLMAPDMLDDVLLVVSELVTNAVRHGRGEVDLQIRFDDGRVTGHVRDEGEGFTGRTEAQRNDWPGHHGLRIVEHLADDWGIESGSAHIWFSMTVEPVGVAGP